MPIIARALPGDAEIMLEIQQRAFADEGRRIGSSLLQSLEAAHADVERFDLTTNTLMEGNVPFYVRHGYRVTELTPYSEKVTLAQMSKPRIAAQ